MADAPGELVIRISGDVKNFNDALDKASKKSEDLKNMLSTTAKVSAIAWAALTAEIGFAVTAFAESEAAVNKLTSAMQNQGIYSKDLLEDYQKQADALQQLSGISDEETLAAQAAIQAHLGEIKVTQDLTNAIADLATAKGMSMVAAADMIGKAVDGNTKILKQYGIEIETTGTKQQQLAQIMQFVEGNFRGQAAAAGEGLGIWKVLAQNFGDLQEEIGKRFAPALTALGQALNSVIKYAKENKWVVDLATSFIAAGAALAGLITVLSAAGIAFLTLKAALTAAGVAMTATSLAVKTLVGATGIGLLLVILSEVYLNWNSIWPRMQAIFETFVNNIGKMAMSLGKLIFDALTGNWKALPEDWKRMTEVLSNGIDEYHKIVDEKMAEQDAKEEEKEKDKLEKNRARKLTYAELDKEDRRRQVEELLAENEEYQAMTEEQQGLFRQKYLENYQQQVLTEKQARGAVADEQMQEQIKMHNKLLIDRQKYGETYAKLDQFIGNEKVTRTRELSNQLIQMQNSENATLKMIGKAAAITNITIDSARGAMRAFSGAIEAFGVPVGPIVGGILAAAVVAYGAEQIGRVTGAKDGGVITGGIRGRDSVPALLAPGELVVPERNFNEVIDAMVMARGGQPTGVSEAVGTGGGFAKLEISLKESEFMDFIEMKLTERENLNISLRRSS